MLTSSQLSILLLSWTAGCVLYDILRVIPKHKSLQRFLAYCCAPFTPSLSSEDLDQHQLVELQVVQWKRKALVGIAVLLLGCNWCRASYSYAADDTPDNMLFSVALGLAWVGVLLLLRKRKLNSM